MSPQQRQDREYFKARKSSVYRLQLANLNPAKINPLHRMKLFLWIMQHTSSTKFSRKSYALACYYFDIFTQRSVKMEAQSIQGYGIVCLGIACKFQEGAFIKFQNDLFPMPKIIQLQEQVLLKLKFNINPDTYIIHLQHILCQWDMQVTSDNSLNKLTYLNDDEESYFRASELYNRLDLMNLIIHSLRFDYGQMALNVFFVANYFNHYQKDYNSFSQQIIAELIKYIYQEKSEYVDIFVHFLQRQNIKDKQLCLDIEIGLYVASFMKMQKFRTPLLMNANYRSSLNKQAYTPHYKSFASKMIKDM